MQRVYYNMCTSCLLISSSKCQNISGDISEMKKEDIKDAVDIIHSTVVSGVTLLY